MLAILQVWNTNGVEGVHRFLARAWRLFEGGLSDGAPDAEQLRLLHSTIKRVRDCISFCFYPWSFPFATAATNVRRRAPDREQLRLLHSTVKRVQRCLLLLFSSALVFDCGWKVTWVSAKSAPEGNDLCDPVPEPAVQGRCRQAGVQAC